MQAKMANARVLAFASHDVYLVLGCNSFQTRQLLAKYPDSPIVATCRNPSIATDLQALKEKYPSQLIVMKLDVTDEQSAEVFLEA
jgi:hypothetical protein